MSPANRPVAPLAVDDVRSEIDVAADDIIGWVLSAVLLVTGHALQLVALGNPWKDERSGWEFVGSETRGSGWALWSVLLLAASFVVAMLALRERRPMLLWFVAGISVLRIVTVVLASKKADFFSTGFGVGLSIGILVATALAAAFSTSLAAGRGTRRSTWNR